MIVRDYFSRKSWINLLVVKKEDAYKDFKCFSVDTYTEGPVETVRPDRRSDLCGRLDDVSIDEIKLEYTAVNSPRKNGSIERAISIVDDTQLAARIQDPHAQQLVELSNQVCCRLHESHRHAK